jgi:hypothetical protein
MMFRSESERLLSEIRAVAMWRRTADDLRSQVLISPLIGMWLRPKGDGDSAIFKVSLLNLAEVDFVYRHQYNPLFSRSSRII